MSTALDMLSIADPLIAKTRSPALIDVDTIGLSGSDFTIFTIPCHILKYIPAAARSPPDAEHVRSVIEPRRAILNDATSSRSFIDDARGIDDVYFFFIDIIA
jgi:hypothetical protein